MSLLDTHRSPLEFECLVLEVLDDHTSVIGTPGSALLSDGGEWIEVDADAISARSRLDAGPQLTVDGWDLPVVLKKVSSASVSRAPVGHHELRRFITGAMMEARPPIRGTLAAYFVQNETMGASETDT